MNTDARSWDILPNGAMFAFWEDETEYSKTYHVAQRHPSACDDKPGTEDQPFATISRAAAILEPGEKVVVHAGVYRECVRPPRGGSAPDMMIAYEAAPGEEVVVKGSEEWQPDAQTSAGWNMPQLENGVRVWMADLPADAFEAYNPFLVRNAYEYLDTYADLSDKDFVRRAMLRRGMIFFNGTRLQQVYRFSDLAKTDGTFWVEEPGGRVHFRLPGDVDPAGAVLEVTTREQVFAPRESGLGYIRISGIHFAHAADGLPVPQRACVSTSRGHHWIVEDCRIDEVNAVGLDIGAQHWSASVPEPTGHHVIRRNAVRNCGICGIAGALGVHHSLIEANTIEHIGYHNLERMWECAGLKFHLAENCLFRRNVFRHLRHAGGIWLDCRNVNNRITNNVFADIESLTGAIYSEMNYDENVVDHNVIWNIRAPRDESSESTNSASALKCDCNEKMIAAYNLFGRIEGDAIKFSLAQSNRSIDGRTGLCRSNAALNNVFYACRRRVHLGRREENRSDGNLFDAADDNGSFSIAYPEPGCHQNLAAWQEFFGLDTHSTQARLEMDFSAETLTLTWQVEGEIPVCQSVDGIAPASKCGVPGPFDPDEWRQSITGKPGHQRFPIDSKPLE